MPPPSSPVPVPPPPDSAPSPQPPYQQRLPSPPSGSSSRPSAAAPSAAGPPASTSVSAPAPAAPAAQQRPLRLDTSVATSADAGPSSSTSYYAEDIEMDPIAPAGHRRRRSSLMNPLNGAASPGNGRARGQSVRRDHSSGLHHDEPKIEEESGDEAGLRSGTDPLLADDSSVSDEDLHDDEETGLTKKDRRRKQKRRRRNTLLDQRIVRDNNTNITDEERKEADQNVVKKLVLNGSLIVLWYLFSLSISLYNKWMFDDEKLNFPFPLFTTAIHMIVQFTLASLVLYFIPSLRPKSPARHRSDLGQSRHEPETQAPLMTKIFYLTRIGPCGAATGLDIGLGNTSLKFITLTFYTMCKSSSLAFVLIFAFLFRLETPTWKLVAIIATMTMGVVMMVAGEVEFKLGGFVLVISAAFFSGFRWGLTQILLLRNPATSNPFSSIFFLAPVMFLTLICIAVPVEGFGALVEGLKGLAAEWGVMVAPLLVIFPGTIAFLMTASEFALLQRTSVVTLSIAGIFKEVVTISAAALVFDDKLTPINISGLFITLGAIVSYNWIKIAKMREDAQRDVHHGHEVIDAAGATSSSSNSGSDVDADAEDGGGEETGLLRRSVEENVVTLDGDFIPTGPVEESVAHEHKSERED